MIYKTLFILGMLYDLVGVPARGYINYKSRHGEPKRDDVMIILGITYLLMTLSYIVVIAIAVNISKTAEAHGVGKNIKKRM